MDEIKKHNNNKTIENTSANDDQFTLNHLNRLSFLPTPIMFFLSGMLIWNSLDNIGLSHLFIETIKSNATLYTIGAFLLLISYVFVVYALLLIFSLFSIYHRSGVFGSLAVILVLCFLIVFFFISWCYLKSSGIQLIFLISFVIMAVYCVLTYSSKKSDDYKPKNLNKNLGISFLIFTCLLSTIIVFFPNLNTHFILNMASFSQTPSKSTWYVLDEDYIRKFKLEQPLLNNDVQTSQLDQLKKQFIKTPQENELPFPLDNSLYHQPNALYGYFLWNIGETRVFCPKSFNIKTIDKNHDKAVAFSCLIIKEQYIQPLAWSQ